MSEHEIRQMYVVQYETIGSQHHPGLRPPPEKSVASLNTHDVAPFRAFMDGMDIDDRADLGFIDINTARKERKQRELVRRALGSFHAASQFLAESQANIVLVNLEDLWEETLPQNVPATSTERPNWRRRVRPSIEQIRKMADAAKELSNVFAQRSRSLPV
jgi:4-alpha-glucanotransferase